MKALCSALEVVASSWKKVMTNTSGGRSSAETSINQSAKPVLCQKVVGDPREIVVMYSILATASLESFKALSEE